MPTIPYIMAADKKLVDPMLYEAIEDVPEYWNGRARRWPGASTIAGLTMNPTPLAIWANRQGLEGVTYHDALNKAADAGTLAHLMFECDIRNKPQPDLSNYPEEIHEPALNAFAEYLKWKKQVHLKPLDAERSLMSPKWLAGATIDVPEIEGEKALIDWKTASGLFESHLVQLCGGYSIIWRENNPEIPVHKFYVIRFSRDNADFDHHKRENLPECELAFKHARCLYELIKQVKKRT